MHASGGGTLGRRGAEGPAMKTTAAPPTQRRRARSTAAQRHRRHHPIRAAATPSHRRHETVLLDLHDQLVPYEAAWAWQKRYVDEMCAAKMAALARAPTTEAATTPNQYTASPCRDALILLQHPPVYTLGAGATRDHLRFDPESPPLPLHRVERGGEVTYHGPGQLVLYPLLDLGRGEGGAVEEGAVGAAGENGAAATAAAEKGEAPSSPSSSSSSSWPPRSRDLHWYLRSLEEVAIRALWRASALKGERIEGLTGVWVDGAKVAAVGVRARSWCTYHGLALNIGADLQPFRQIVPCGISDRPVGSVRSALGLPPPPPLTASAAAMAAEACAALASAAGAREGGGLSGAAEAAAAVAAARDPLVAEYRAALLEAFEEVFDARLTTGSVSGMMMGGGEGWSSWEAVAPKKEAVARAGAA